ncbi:glycoside hydrolase family 28 protein [Autumnicola edwardsiae]|uniref:Glycoside hydrolase family 28 protein n=1 Tax=Autumnicola edwardsiae TaxID=3075594 RepID=A0ABU3CT50_9FLAO|nr:glycoside hydrolase family 28 protein [Zunongwangia sp. F297]MDT0649539.1 glycoside hydrolase family 28 protein [Zunongwangia sp. F297]
MKNLKKIFLVFLISSCVHLYGQNQEEYWKKAEEIVKGIHEPEIPDRIFSITEFGAVADGSTMNTEAIKKAINECNKQGGGTVLVKGGVFLTGPIHLKSNVNLHIDKNATVKFSTEPKDYLPMVLTRWEGDDCYNYSPLIYAIGQNNFSITGKGILDGQASAENWWPWKGGKKGGWVEGSPSQLDEENRPMLKKFNDTQVPVYKRQMAGHYLRPQFINFMYCNNLKIEGIIKNSPFWEIHPLLSENIIIRDIVINSLGPNNDGIDPESCRNVLIENCTFNTGDDCIALKSGRDYDGRRAGIPIENVVIRNCDMRNGHGGVAIGSEIAGGVKNIFVENCKMSSPDLDRAIRIKTNSNRGGITDGVYVRNISVGQVNIAAVSINCSYHIDREGEGEFPPVVKNIYVSNLNTNQANYALWLQGIEGNDSVKNIYISNCDFKGVEKENEIDNVDNLNVVNVTINGKQYLYN